MGWTVLIYFFLEVYTTIEIGGAIGGLATILIMIFTALFGIWILKSYKSILSESLFGLMQGTKTVRSLIAGNLLALLGAILLIIPGFLSDFMGLLMQMGFISTFFVNRLNIKPNKENQYYNTQNSYQTQKGDDDVIDVEIIEHTSTINK